MRRYLLSSERYPHGQPISAEELKLMSHDGQSWFNFLQLLAGRGPALMKVRKTDGSEETVTVIQDDGNPH